MNLGSYKYEAHVSFHFIAHFEPIPGKELQLRDQLLRVVGPTRAESGCVKIQLFESLDSPVRFALHSEWVSEAEFVLHEELPHTVDFVAAASALLTHEMRGIRGKPRGGSKLRKLQAVGLVKKQRS